MYVWCECARCVCLAVGVLQHVCRPCPRRRPPRRPPPPPFCSLERYVLNCPPPLPKKDPAQFAFPSPPTTRPQTHQPSPPPRRPERIISPVPFYPPFLPPKPAISTRFKPLCTRVSRALTLCRFRRAASRTHRPDHAACHAPAGGEGKGKEEKKRLVKREKQA